MEPIENYKNIVKEQSLDTLTKHSLKVYSSKPCHRNRKQLREFIASYTQEIADINETPALNPI
jgi:hypothetical protein